MRRTILDVTQVRKSKKVDSDSLWKQAKLELRVAELEEENEKLKRELEKMTKAMEKKDD